VLICSSTSTHQLEEGLLSFDEVMLPSWSLVVRIDDLVHCLLYDAHFIRHLLIKSVGYSIKKKIFYDLRPY
jgi:hypothetical protein